MDINVIAKMLKYYRKKCHLTQAQVADSLCVTQQAVAKWESGQAVPQIEKMNELAALYGVFITDLMSDSIHLNVAFEQEDQIPDIAENLEDLLKTAKKRSLTAEEQYEKAFCEATLAHGHYTCTYLVSDAEEEDYKVLRRYYPDLSRKEFVRLCKERILRERPWKEKDA